MLASDGLGGGGRPHFPVLLWSHMCCCSSQGPTGPLWPIAALALLLCRHTQARQHTAVQRGYWATDRISLCSSEHPLCYTHSSLVSAARDGGSKTEPPALQAASGYPDPQLYWTTITLNAAAGAIHSPPASSSSLLVPGQQGHGLVDGARADSDSWQSNTRLTHERF